jgi:HSP20 family molecular chaperone IbpA
MAYYYYTTTTGNSMFSSSLGAGGQSIFWDDTAYINQLSDEASVSYLFRVTGCGKEDVSVTYSEEYNNISIRAESEYTRYSRMIPICKKTLDISGTQCSVKNGVLTIKIPKKKKQEKKVEIN